MRICVVWCLLALDGTAMLWGADSRAALTGVAAIVNGESITEAQLEAALRPQLQALEERMRQIREAALNKLIDNLLLEQAARKEGVTVDRYLDQRVASVGVTSADVDSAYERSREQFPGVLPAEAKYRIRRTLEDNARADAFGSLLTSLRRLSTVTNNLVASAAVALEAASFEGPSRGRPDASVTIIEFSDFECPYCRSAQPVLTKILRRWPDQVRHVFKHFPLDQHANAIDAARGALCANRQDRFWPLHDRIFAMSEVNGAALRSAAEAAGLHMNDFDACMRSDETADHVRKDLLVGRRAGVTGTPAFFVNGALVATPELESAVARVLGGSK